MTELYQRTFPKGKLVIGMIHLAGEDPVKRAVEEFETYWEGGVHALIVENYHANNQVVPEAMNAIDRVNTLTLDGGLKAQRMIIGVNILPNEYDSSMVIAKHLGGKFIQLDHVAGTYVRGGTIDQEHYGQFRKINPEIAVLGGVWPKYYQPVPGSKLEQDLAEAMKRADAIVVTGEGTGKETPLDKIKYFRDVIGDFPLIIGAGLTAENAAKQMQYADGAIVGSYFKNGKTTNEVELARVRDLVQAVMEAK